MRKPTLLATGALLLVSVYSVVAGQEPTPGAGRGGRGRGGDAMRAFLGLTYPKPNKDASDRGQVIYDARCASCHGPLARGTAYGPNLVRSELVVHDNGSGDQVGPLVRQGRISRNMPAFPELSAAEIADLTQFLQMQVELVANRGLYERTNATTGDVAAGKDFFFGKGKCSTCHSITGDLKGIGSRSTKTDELQGRFLFPTTTRPRQAKVTQRDDRVVSGTVKQLGEFDVTIVDAAGVAHTWPRDEVKVELGPDPLAGHQAALELYTDRDVHNVTAFLKTIQ